MWYTIKKATNYFSIFVLLCSNGTTTFALPTAKRAQGLNFFYSPFIDYESFFILDYAPFPAYGIALLVLSIFVCAVGSGALIAFFYFISQGPKDSVSMRIPSLPESAVENLPQDALSGGSSLDERLRERRSTSTGLRSTSSLQVLPSYSANHLTSSSVPAIPIRISKLDPSTTWNLKATITRFKNFMCSEAQSVSSSYPSLGRRTPPISLPIPIIPPDSDGSVPISSSTSHSPILVLSPSSGYYSLQELERPISPSEVLQSFIQSSPSFSYQEEPPVTECTVIKISTFELKSPSYSHGAPLETIFEGSDEDEPDATGSRKSPCQSHALPISTSKSSSESFFDSGGDEELKEGHILLFNDIQSSQSRSLPDIPDETPTLRSPSSENYNEAIVEYISIREPPKLPDNIPTPTLSIPSVLQKSPLLSKIIGDRLAVECVEDNLLSPNVFQDHASFSGVVEQSECVSDRPLDQLIRDGFSSANMVESDGQTNHSTGINSNETFYTAFTACPEGSAVFHAEPISRSESIHVELDNVAFRTELESNVEHPVRTDSNPIQFLLTSTEASKMERTRAISPSERLESLSEVSG
ncbi:hypothetical protein M422DRAFT_72469 [Sphaerobolus stellatus SS14]|uniref:Uncharacterized protein n=1 Tax=Sphaerobolus stellatus (strain SS14) TaxID=990650 RepID=A0A0C9UER4_SPHS4|nr:hypothetical protein M422DRAFT_72469 [Sphaerobolus stellatus SS14]